MRLFLLLSLLLTPLASFADRVADESQQQDLAAVMEKMQNCMAAVDMAKIQALTQEAQQLNEQIQQLCQDNKESEAQTLVQEFGLRYAENEDLKKLTTCTEEAQKMMPAMAKNMQPRYDPKEYEKQNICDLNQPSQQ